MLRIHVITKKKKSLIQKKKTTHTSIIRDIFFVCFAATRHERVNSPVRKPGCSHSHESDSIWCAEPLNLILTPAKPNWQLQKPTASPVLKPPDQWQTEGGGTWLYWSLCAASLEQPLLCEIQERTGRGDPHRLAVRKVKGVSWRFPGQGCFDEGSPSSKEMAVFSV